MAHKKSLKCSRFIGSLILAMLLLAVVSGTVFGQGIEPLEIAETANVYADYGHSKASLEPEAGQSLLNFITERGKSAFLASHNIDQQMIHDYAVSANRIAAVGFNRNTATPGALAPGDSLIVDVSDDLQYLVTVDHLSFNHNTTTLSGRVAESYFGFFHMTSADGQTMAVLRIPEENRVYHITYSNSGLYHLYEFAIDEFEQFKSLPPLIPQEQPVLLPEELKRTELKASGDQQVMAGNPADPATIDVMVVYTPAARVWAGSTAAMNNIINQAMLRAQEANDNSNTGITLRLVHSAEVDFVESGNISWDLNYVTYDGNDEMDIVHTWRDQYGADLVALITEGNQGGISWLYKGPAWDAEQYGFSVSNVNKVGTTYLLIHEIGHNLGAHHHKKQSHQPGPNTDLNNYSAGWRFQVDSTWYSTVMSYSDGFFFRSGTPCAGMNSIEVGYFSTPLINYPGSSIALGHVADGDNARTLRETKHSIAAFRNGSTTYNLNVNSTNPASGVQISSSTGHGGTTSYTRSLGQDTSVTLTAPEYHGSGAARKRFENWSGAVSSTNLAINVTMSTNRTVTANYVDDPELNSNATLAALTVSPGSLSPAFAPATTAYNVAVGQDISSVNITATLADDNATLNIGGAAATSGVARAVNLGAAGTSTPVAIVVAAADGTTEKTYRVTVNRAGTTTSNIPKYIFYENSGGDLVRADYQQAESDLFKPNPDRSLVNAIRRALIRAFQDQNRRAIYVVDESGRVLDYARASRDGLTYSEAHSSADYWTDLQNPVKELIINPVTEEPEEREL